MSDDGEFDSFSATSSEDEEKAISSPTKHSIFGPILTEPEPPRRQSRVVDVQGIKRKNDNKLLKKYLRCLAAHRLWGNNDRKLLRSCYTRIASYNKTRSTQPRPEPEPEPSPQPVQEAAEDKSVSLPDPSPVASAPEPEVQEPAAVDTPPTPVSSPLSTPARRPASAPKASPILSKASTPSLSPMQGPHTPRSNSSSSSSSSCAPIRRPATGFAELLINPRAREQDKVLHEDDALVRVVCSVPSKRSSHVQQGAPVLSIRRRKRPAWEDLSPGIKIPTYDASRDPHCKQLFGRPQQQKLLARAEKGTKDVAQQRKLSAGAKLAWRFVVNNTYGKKKGEAKSISPTLPAPCVKAVMGLRVAVPSGKRMRTCSVVGVRGSEVKVHYEGHTDAYDEWLQYDGKRFKETTTVGLGQRVVHPSHIPPGVVVENLHQPIEQRASLAPLQTERSSQSSSVQDPASDDLRRQSDQVEAVSLSGSDGHSYLRSGSENSSHASNDDASSSDVAEQARTEEAGSGSDAGETDAEGREASADAGEADAGAGAGAREKDSDSEYSDSYEDDFV